MKALPIISSLLLMPLVCQQTPKKVDKTPRPNIVFILADDLGWGDLSCHGNPQYKTPNIDKLAKEGIDFHNFYVNGAVCSPSRAGIITGRFPSSFGINNALSLARNVNVNMNSVDWLDPQAPNIAGLLQEAGYNTVHFGKWHLTGEDGIAVDAPTLDEYGFDEWLAMRGPKSWPLSGMRQNLTEHAINFIKRKHDKPFFLNLWIHETHVPHGPSKESLEINNEFDSRTRVYASVVSDGDREIGRVLEALRESGLEKNTLVIFASDNGPALAKNDPEAPLNQYFDLGSTGGFRGNKGSFYDGGVRVPLIVRWPGHTPSNKIDEKTVISGVDFLPTICAAAGIELPGNFQCDGENMLSAFEGHPRKRSNPIFWMKKDQGKWLLAALVDEWKIIMNEEKSLMEIYNLKDDPREQTNKASMYPEKVSELSQLVLEWKASLPAQLNPECISIYRKSN